MPLKNGYVGSSTSSKKDLSVVTSLVTAEGERISFFAVTVPFFFFEHALRLFSLGVSGSFRIFINIHFLIYFNLIFLLPTYVPAKIVELFQGYAL